MENNETRKYRIFDIKSKIYVGSIYKDAKRARRRVDFLDNEYGSYRYVVKEIYTLTAKGE